MFVVGDKIVYPMHGAGIIEDVEEKKILGETKEYFVLRVPGGDMKIMIPVHNVEEIGIRSVISEEEIAPLFSMLEGPSSSMPDNWNRRYRENMEKLKTGDIFQVAEVVRNLLRADQIKKLSTGEKKMLTNAKQILISEITLCLGCMPEDAEEQVLSRVLNE
ncbi:MAG TPA: CarD family transcriptional regulator [Clostridiales bacterium]|jgi:CarD family transcriptional regulator|nr:CarD family transcriptional regulator [Clostridiales bacterium]